MPDEGLTYLKRQAAYIAYTGITALLAWAQLVLVGVKSAVNIIPITLIAAQTKKAT